MKISIIISNIIFTIIFFHTNAIAENSWKSQFNVFEDNYQPLVSNETAYDLSMFACPSSALSPPCIQETTSFFANTTLAANDCALRSSQDYVIQIDIPYDGSWTFQTCSVATSFNTYIYLGTTCCGDEIGSDDDNCTGNAGSLYTTTLTEGTYFLAVEGFSPADIGTFLLEIIPNDPIPTDFLRD